MNDNTPIDKLIDDKDAVKILKEQGYDTYGKVKNLSIDELYKIKGIGTLNAWIIYKLKDR